MRRASAGLKAEPIDVDDYFNTDGVEEVAVKRSPSLINGSGRRVEPTARHRRLQKRPRPAHGLTSEQPIVLESDEDEERGAQHIAIAEDRGSGNANVVASRKLETPLTQLKHFEAQRGNQVSSGAAVRSVPSRMVNSQFCGLTLPVSSPSPRKSVPTASSSTRLLKRESSTPQHDLFEDPEIKRDVDTATTTLATTELEDDSDMPDDLWEWSDFMASDNEDDELNDYIDIEEALKERESKTVQDRTVSSKVCRSWIMLKPETSTLRIPTDNQMKRKPHEKSRRVWHTVHTETYGDRYHPLSTDYRRLIRPMTGVLARKTVPERRNVFNCWLNVPPLRLSSPQLKDLRTSGTIGKIAQSHEFIAVSSAAKGGGADSNTRSGPPEVDTYNREGNLFVWRNQKYLLLDGHSRSWPVEDGSLRRSTKYYTVSDVAFDPLRPNRLVSSGHDCAVRVVDLEICGDTFSPRTVHTFEYPRVPYDIAYKPDSSLFAVSCFDGNIYVHKDTDRFALSAANRRDTRPGTFIWGANSSNGMLKNMLFASTESDQDNICRHTAFDVDQQCEMYEVDICDSSDAMALDPQGRMLALVTSKGNDPSHTLSLFDVGNNSGERVAGTRPFVLKRDARTHPRLPLETTQAEFSPDGILLALGRSDHRVHVYDVRHLGMNGEGRLWAEFVHPPVERPRNEHEEYGVTALKWVDGWSPDGRGRTGLGLVSAGADDCVRLWDAMRPPSHPDESMVLAKVDMDVSCFSIGKAGKNEHRLIVGDCAGEVHIFD